MHSSITIQNFVVRIFLEEINTFIQQECIKLIKKIALKTFKMLQKFYFK